MSLDVVDLRNFYAQPLGAVARRFVSRGIRARWPETRDQRICGVGYATPYLGLFREEAERCLAFMPAAQGVVKWPSKLPTLTALVEDRDLPLADAAVDRVLLVHALEMSMDAEAMLRDVWRVLAPGGRLLAVTNHRKTSLGALRRVLRAAAARAHVSVDKLKDLPAGLDCPDGPDGPVPSKSVLVTLGRR